MLRASLKHGSTLPACRGLNRGHHPRGQSNTSNKEAQFKKHILVIRFPSDEVDDCSSPGNHKILHPHFIRVRMASVARHGSGRDRAKIAEHFGGPTSRNKMSRTEPPDSFRSMSLNNSVAPRRWGRLLCSSAHGPLRTSVMTGPVALRPSATRKEQCRAADRTPISVPPVVARWPVSKEICFASHCGHTSPHFRGVEGDVLCLSSNQTRRLRVLCRATTSTS
jgi:hypothetical protein